MFRREYPERPAPRSEATRAAQAEEREERRFHPARPERTQPVVSPGHELPREQAPERKPGQPPRPGERPHPLQPACLPGAPAVSRAFRPFQPWRGGRACGSGAIFSSVRLNRSGRRTAWSRRRREGACRSDGKRSAARHSSLQTWRARISFRPPRGPGPCGRPAPRGTGANPRSKARNQTGRSFAPAAIAW